MTLIDIAALVWIVAGIFAISTTVKIANAADFVKEEVEKLEGSNDI